MDDDMSPSFARAVFAFNQGAYGIRGGGLDCAGVRKGVHSLGWKALRRDG